MVKILHIIAPGVAHSALDKVRGLIAGCGCMVCEWSLQEVLAEVAGNIFGRDLTNH